MNGQPFQGRVFAPYIPRELFIREMFVTSEGRDIHRGDTVTHPQFGTGEVIALLNPVRAQNLLGTAMVKFSNTSKVVNCDVLR